MIYKMVTRSGNVSQNDECMRGVNRTSVTLLSTYKRIHKRWPAWAVLHYRTPLPGFSVWFTRSTMFFGNVWQKIAQILLCVCILPTLVNGQGVTGAAGGAVGENAGEIREKERVCKATTNAFEEGIANDDDGIFNQWKENIGRLRERSRLHYFTRKPSTRKLHIFTYSYVKCSDSGCYVLSALRV